MSFINKILSLFSSKNEEPTLCCSKCKHLFFWNDGSAGCDIDKEYTCIPSGYVLWEEEDEPSQQEMQQNNAYVRT